MSVNYRPEPPWPKAIKHAADGFSPTELMTPAKALQSTLQHARRRRLASGAERETAKATAAEIRKSRTPDHLTSFIDGKTYKSLKRHLGRLA